MMIGELIGMTRQAACHGKTEHGIFVKFEHPSKTAVVLLAGVTIIRNSVPPALHRTIWCRSTKFLRSSQRYDDFKLIRITCQAACLGKTEHGIFVMFKKPSNIACRFTCRSHHLGYSVPPALNRTIWCRTTRILCARSSVIMILN